MKKLLKGFTLIELILFIVIVGITAIAVLTAFQNILRDSPDTNRTTTAIELAEARMEFILGQYYINGYSSFSDLCTGGSPPAVCLSLTGYTVTSGIVTSGSTKTITVTVSGNGSAILTTEVRS